MHSKIRAFIFDIGNVLLPVDYQRAKRRLLKERHTFLPAQEELIARTCVEYEHGRIGRAEFLAQIKRACQYQDSDESFIEIWCDIFEENIALQRQIPFLADTYPLYLLSNTGGIHREFIHSRYPIFTHFISGVYSYEVGVMKPDSRIYQIAKEQFGVIPEETLFIDDLPENVEGARTAGFQGFVYNWKRHDLFETELSSRNLHPFSQPCTPDD